MDSAPNTSSIASFLAAVGILLILIPRDMPGDEAPEAYAW
jgi:hypothetical protein